MTGADRFRFYDTDLDGVERDFSDNPDIRRNFSGRVLRINKGRLDSEGTIRGLARATMPADTSSRTASKILRSAATTR